MVFGVDDLVALRERGLSDGYDILVLMPVAPSTQWEELFRAWDEFLLETTWERVTEASVAGNFAGKLLELLDWQPAQRPFGVKLDLRVGSTWRAVFPDIVLAPRGKEFAKTPGEVYAVIELKRPELADEDARQQAQCYADHLRAPIYAVLDGHRIRVWHRRLVHDDFEELNLPRAKFRSEFDNVRKFLGRSQLETLHDASKRAPDVIAAAREHAAKVDHNTPSVRLRIEGGEVRASLDRGEFLDANLWWGHPVGSPSPLQLSIEGSFNDWQLVAPDLVDAIARIAIHEAQVRLAVDEPAHWKEVLRGPLHLERHHATEAIPHVNARVDPKDAKEELGAPAALARELHAALDAWALGAVKHRVDRLLNGTGDSTHKHWLNQDVRNRLGTSWQVDASWLKSALRASMSDDAQATTRLGPQTLAYLVDGVLFPMAVARVLADLRPGADPGFPHNLDHGNGGGTPSKIGFAYALDSAAQLECDTFLLLLSSSSLSANLVRPERPIGAPPEAVRKRWRIGEKAERGIVCCLSEDARTLLEKKGWEPFAEHLTKHIRDQHALGDPACPPPPSTPSVPPSNSDGSEAAAA